MASFGSQLEPRFHLHSAGSATNVICIATAVSDVCLNNVHNGLARQLGLPQRVALVRTTCSARTAVFGKRLLQNPVSPL